MRIASILKRGAGVALAAATVGCGGSSSPTTASNPLVQVIALRAELNPAYSETIRVQAIATITIAVLRDSCGVVRFEERRDGRTLHLTPLPFETLAACTQPASAGDRIELQYGIVGPLDAGDWFVEAGGRTASFTVR